MPDVKISGLPAGTVTGASTVPAVTSGVTHRTTVQDSANAGLAAYSINIGNSTIGLGIATPQFQRVRMAGTMTGGAPGLFSGLLIDGLYAADVTNARAASVYPSTQNSASPYTIGQMVGYYSTNGAKGTNCTITTNYGFLADAGLVQGNFNYAFFGNLPANASTWNFYANGAAPNYFAGNVRIGTLSQTIASLSVFDVVGGRSSFTSNDNLAIGLKNTVGGTLTYIGASVAGDMQVSAAGGGALFTVLQGGNVGVGTTAPAVKLDVNGNAIRIQTASTQATSAAAGNVGEIRWDDTYLYVRISTGWRRVALGAAF